MNPRSHKFAKAYVKFGQTLLGMDNPVQAEACFQKALDYYPEDLTAIRQLLISYERSNQTDKAKVLSENGLGFYPEDPVINLTTAKLERRSGRIKQGLQRLENIVQSRLPDKIFKDCSYELGLLYDAAGEYEKAVGWFDKGNETARKMATDQGISSANALAEVNRLKHYMSAEARAHNSVSSVESGSPAPCFLIGFPRSGTTLLDVVLDSHPGIHVLEEKPMVYHLKELCEKGFGPYPDALNRLSEDEVRKLSQSYFREAASYLSGRSFKVLVDKMPLNTINMAIINKVFPEAKIIFMARYPYDVCLSCYMQNFQVTDKMANFFSIGEAAQFYSETMKLWMDYTEKLSLNLFQVKYEDLVTDFRGEVSRLLEFIGLQWDDSIFNYRVNLERRIKTPSYAQVADAVHAKKIFHSIHYVKLLKPIKKVLEPFARHFNYPSFPEQKTGKTNFYKKISS